MEVPLSLQSHSVGGLHYEVRLFFEKAAGEHFRHVQRKPALK